MTLADRRAPTSLLGLWHPAGAPARPLALGAGATAPGAAADGSPIDFALVAPGPAEASARWLQESVAETAARLEAEGVLCVVVPRRHRQDAQRLIRRAGFSAIGTLLMVPPWPRSAHVMSLAAPALRDAGTRHLGLHPATASGVAAVAGTSAGRALGRRVAPGCALLAARSAATDPLRWLAALDGSPGRCAATATIGARRDAQVAAVLRFTTGARTPDLLVKVALCPTGLERLERERAALQALGDAARRAGAGIAAVVAAPAPGLLAASALPGSPASALLARDPALAAEILTALGGWLARWNAATSTRAPAQPEWLHRLLVAPAERLEAVGSDAPLGQYVAALRSLAERLAGREVVLTATHNDLTMSNVLVAGGHLSVVDWEGASAAGPPLSDLWYAIADGVSRARRVAHAQAVRALARRCAPLPAALAYAPEEHARGLGLAEDESLLSFHACWLHHAGNELDRGARDGPFRAVVEAVAAARLLWPGAGDAARAMRSS